MKLKDLLKGRDKLRKYDELKEWKERFERASNDTAMLECTIPRELKGMYFKVPGYIRKIIVDAIDAEINKMEEE